MVSPKALGVPVFGGGVFLFALLRCLLGSPVRFGSLLERHLQDRVLRLERADLNTQRIDDCLRVYVHSGNTNTYNGWYG